MDLSLPSRPVVGILHPGAMGSALGSALKPAAGAVVWASAGRSDATAKRAELADLVAVPDVAELARRSDVVISICPPDAAIDVAKQVADALGGTQGRRPIYVDANAVSPATVAEIGALLGAGRVVDGAVIGPPARVAGQAAVWLSGAAAPAVAELFAGSPFAAHVLGEQLGPASGLKACYAMHTKALPAIWWAMADAAQRYGVTEQLRAELRRTGVELDDRLAELTRRAGAKAWRWAGEMDEAAAALAAVDTPDGFSLAAAQVYRRMTDGAGPAAQ